MRSKTNDDNHNCPIFGVENALKLYIIWRKFFHACNHVILLLKKNLKKNLMSRNGCYVKFYMAYILHCNYIYIVTILTLYPLSGIRVPVKGVSWQEKKRRWSKQPGLLSE